MKRSLEENLEKTRVVAHPLRFKIFMHLMKSPASVKQVSEVVDLSPTKLYYHFKLLEDHGLIRVADTRLVSGIVEKRYEAVPGKYQVPQLPEGSEASSVLHEAFGELEAALEKDPSGPLFHWWNGGMSPARQREFRRRLIALVKELSSKDGGDKQKLSQVGVILALYPGEDSD